MSIATLSLLLCASRVFIWRYLHLIVTGKLSLEVALSTLATFIYSDRKLRPITLTCEYDLNNVNFNQLAKYSRPQSFGSKVIVWTHPPTWLSTWTSKVVDKNFLSQTDKAFTFIVVPNVRSENF